MFNVVHLKFFVFICDHLRHWILTHCKIHIGWNILSDFTFIYAIDTTSSHVIHIWPCKNLDFSTISVSYTPSTLPCSYMIKHVRILTNWVIIVCIEVNCIVVWLTIRIILLFNILFFVLHLLIKNLRQVFRDGCRSMLRILRLILRNSRRSWLIVNYICLCRLGCGLVISNDCRSFSGFVRLIIWELIIFDILWLLS